MDEQLSFIETQFPVSKISKESYKERKANNGQTLTGLGKWWGRKPLVLVRAAILGCLLPSTDNPKKDMDVFLKLMSMDNRGLLLRKEKRFSVQKLYEIVCKNQKLSKYKSYFYNDSGKVKIDRSAPRNEIEDAAFETLGYDEKIAMGKRPEQLDNLSDDTWREVNDYLNTNAHNLLELTKQLSLKRFGHNVIVGDCFCGGGSIPFEAARIGGDVYASDLNPIAGLLTWADINLCGMSSEKINRLQNFQKEVYAAVDKQVTNLGIEENEKGDRAVSYIYCVETVCPECGYKIPLAPSWLIGKRTKTVAIWKENQGAYDVVVKMGASEAEIKQAVIGTVNSHGIVCPHCGKSTPISSIRHDKLDKNGNVVYGLRRWGIDEFEPNTDDVFQERLYAIKYETREGERYYRSPNKRDIENEEHVRKIVASHLTEWQKQGLVPTTPIESGYNTDQIIRERGWSYWHQVFNARQILLMCLYKKTFLSLARDTYQEVVGLLALNRMANWNSKLSMWSNYPTQECGMQTFYNQALNTFFNYATRSLLGMKDTCIFNINNYPIHSRTKIELKDARDVTEYADLWINDPPYADAVNYHELSDYFLSWDASVIKDTFKDWYADSKKVLAVRGDGFSQTMIEIYSNLANHMNENGLQVVMFTHSDPAVWAQLALIMWRSGLSVSVAWNIATETDAGGINNGNYVKGTVLLVLRKQTGTDIAFLDEINEDIREEVKRQISNMQQLDDKEEPNFSDPDYVLAAYAASLKVLTSYKEIEDLDLDYELNKAISDPSNSKVVAIIENAKKIAYDCVIPTDFDNYFWRELTNAEKFYIKGLESEKHGNYQIGTYQEFARGFSIGGYSQLMASERANSARLKTPYEMGDRSMNDVPDFQNSLMRTVFEGIYVAIKNDMNPRKGLDFIKNDIPNYWDKREMIQQILSFLVDINDISNMHDHWADSAEMADALLTVVKHDSI